MFICVFTYFLNYHSFLFFRVGKTQIKTDMVQVLYQNLYGKVYTPKSEVLRTICKNSKIGGFASTANTPKSEILRSFEDIIR